MSQLSRHSTPRRIALAAASTVALTALIAGCASGGAADAGTYTYTPGEETVEVEFWSAAVEGVNQEMVDNFNATRGEELNIHVTVTYQGDYVETEQKVYSSQVADTLPGVFVDEVGMTASFADAGVTLNLDPYLAANDMDDEDFQIGATDNLYVDGEMYALPYMRSVPVMYVNSSLLEQYGFDPAGPQTLEELDEVLRTISAATGEPAMVLPNYDFWVMEALIYSYSGLPVIAEDGTSNMGEQGVVDTVAWLGDLIDAGAVKPLGATEIQDFYTALSSPNNAISLTSSGGIQSFQALAADAGIDLTVSLFPAGDDDSRGVSVGGSNLYVVDTGTDQEKAAAFEFAKWATDTEQAAFASASTGYIAVRKSSQETDTLQAVFEENPAYEVAAKQLTYGKARPMVLSYTEIQALMIERIHAMWANGDDPEQVMPALAEEVDQILSR